MKRDSVKIAASALTLINAVTASTRSSIASLEPSASSGKCRRTEGKKKSIGSWGDREKGRLSIRRSGNQEIKGKIDKDMRG
ncbi:MAG: hypothetical protein A2026_20210 [Deltaproteobacteria bacterium RBG_19FT_COMBO_46_12]|nr:MAG: hypothetical protein A2026_20210 [Deltaproteobacteria bacterium RBG_19FT_COMBO_46_12]